MNTEERQQRQIPVLKSVMVSVSRESSGGGRASKVSISKYVLVPDLWYSGGRVTVHCWRNGLMWDGIRNGLDMELPEAILMGRGRGPFTVGITWRNGKTRMETAQSRLSPDVDTLILLIWSLLIWLTMSDSGPAWSRRSSRSSPIMSVSKSELVSSIGQGSEVLHPFTNVSSGRGADVGTDLSRVNFSKPGGSDGVTEEIPFLGGKSSTTASFRGECVATGAGLGARTGAKTLLSWVDWGTSKTHRGRRRWMGGLCPPLLW